MKIGEPMLAPFSHALLLLLLTGLLVTQGEAGNKDLIENRVQELDELNRQVVGQIDDLPSHGQVDLKAHVMMQGETPLAEILEKKVTVKEEAIDFKTGNVTLRPSVESNDKEQPNERRAN